MQGNGRNINPLLTKITLKKCLYKTISPGKTVRIVLGKKRQWKTTPRPKKRCFLLSHFAQIEAVHFDQFQTASKRLRRLS